MGERPSDHIVYNLDGLGHCILLLGMSVTISVQVYFEGTPFVQEQLQFPIVA